LARKQARQLRVAVAGATGAVGRELVGLLAERAFPAAELRLLASERSVGEPVEYGGEELTVERLEARALEDLDLLLLCTGAEVSRRWAPRAVAAGAVVVDTSAAFRLDPEVPLVVPELNPEALASLGPRRLVACPDGAVLAASLALAPLSRAAGLRRVVVCACLAASQAGSAGAAELDQQTRDLFNFRPVRTERFPRQLAFNCLPRCGAFDEDGSTALERGFVEEIRRLLGQPGLALGVTAVQVPVFTSHGLALHLEPGRALPPDEARALLAVAPGLRLVDDPAKEEYPHGLDAVGQDEVLVGRVRRDGAAERGLALWLAVDNVRRGAALTAVQIAERLASALLCR
jgi:aspartate-semialdehyde dehydrogenase